VRRFAILILAIVALALWPPEGARSGSDVGIVLLHGKWGTALPGSPIGKLAGALENAGFLVVAPDMPWSRSRYYAKDYEASMAEIDDAVASLEDRGASRIVVGGHSMGANVALGYGARRDGLAGIIVMAPGHAPELVGGVAIARSHRRARQMIGEGKGDETADFADMNQGRRKTVNVTALVYASWFDPDGPAVMPINAANMRPSTPLLWLVGREDRMYARGEGYAFSLAPAHPRNMYAVVPGGHRATPMKGKTRIIDWLNGL
jgi:pimeloyl-ACP methyl ester carboxylesterase